MAVDTSRASERLRAWNEGDDDALPRGYTHDSLDFQRDLRALLARAEAAEGKAGSLQRRLDVEAAANDEAVQAVAALKARAEAAEKEAYDLRLTILGGEDAPGFAGSIPLEKVKELHDKHLLTLQWRAEDAERQRAAAIAERDRLRAFCEKVATPCSEPLNSA